MFIHCIGYFYLECHRTLVVFEWIFMGLLEFPSVRKKYCETLNIRETLFSRGQQPRFIHETLFLRFVIYPSIILAFEFIGDDFIFASLCSRDLRENKVLANKKCFTVETVF